MDEGDLSMKMCDVVLVGYAVNSTSGGYTNRDVKYVDTVGIKYLYSHFYGTYCAEPVAFLQLAAQMRAVGIDTYILDGLLLGYSRNEMEQYLKKIKTDIYCFSLYESSKADILYLMHYVKKINPNAIIITGGPYVTLCYRELIEQEKVIDYIVIGDGDFAMRDLVTALLYKKSHHNIPNVVYRDKNGQVAMDVCPEAVDMDELIAPSRDFVDIIKQKGFSLSLASSRGCGHGVCSFCYDLDAVERIYINGDGAAWIRTGEKIIPKSKFALDKYHMHKYIIAATSHLEDSAEDARGEIYRAIHRKKKWMAEGAFDRIIGITDKETKRKAVEQAKAYILGNWSGIMIAMKSGDSNVRCSAEGHVSHVYADRMSSRPLGWCRTGADKMSRLRIYRQNQGNMLELVRYQKKEMKQVSGAEEIIYSATEMIRMEKANKRKLGVLADLPVYDIPYPQIKKIAALKNHIWGL